MSPEIPWDDPSPHGAVGRAARTVLGRALKPVLVRQQAVDDELRARLSDLEGRLTAHLQSGAGASSGGPEDLGDVYYRVDVLERRAELAPACALLADVPLPAAGARRKVVAHDWRPDEPRRVLCCGGTGVYATMMEVTAVTMIAYARRHRWDLVLTLEGAAAPRPSAWNKIVLVQQLLEEYSVVGWIDADAIIVDGSEDIGAELDDEHDLYIVAHSGGTTPAETLNSGVFMVRDTDWAKRFLAAVWDQDDLIDHMWWENAAIMRLLGWDLDAEPPRPTGDTDWSARVKLMDQAWNSVALAGPAPQPKINHYAGLPVPHRQPSMLDDLTTAVVRRHSSDPTAHVTSRDDLPVMLNRFGLVAVGAEVGVQSGAYSAWILHRWAGASLISIDPWQADDSEAYIDIANVEQSRHDELYRATVHRLAPFGTRSQIWRTTGTDAIRLVDDGALSFVYLDARHAEADVAEDLALWEPKVQLGGIVAGHDYFDGVIPAGDFGVKSAVDRYFGERDWTIHETVADRPFSSWWVIKPRG
jgi:Methyltransferase domain/galactosyl transferase GMA12/MNN10 family